MPKTLPRRARFGAFELDLDTGELCGSGRTVQLGEKPFRILITLVEHGGQLVTRETLQERLWPNDTVVDFEHGINTAIKTLRRALDDSADSPKYVETVPRRGYRLMVPVEPINGTVDPEPPGASTDTKPFAARSGGMTGKVVSHYRVLDLIGGGGMGVVYRAEDLKLGRIVALKFLSEELGDDPAALERFHLEARAISVLDHPNICPIYEFGEHAGLPFLVMPLLQGQILRDRLAESVAKREALPLEELLGVGLDISAGLQAAHQKGIIHRDIKPANVFLTDHGHAKILDFGVAKVAQPPIVPVESPAEPLAGNRSDLTSPRSCLGTYPYMSPEQVEGKELDARTDLFSLGVVLCEMATGSLAFTGGGSDGAFKALADEKVPLNIANANISTELKRIIHKALEKDRALRYQTAAEMRADLSRLKRDSGRETPAAALASAPSGPVIRRLWPRVLLTVSVALLLAAAAFFTFRARRSAMPTRSSWVQITAFSDGATSPALSPDGRMIAFIRGPETFVSPGQIYVKMLPDGEPAQLTHDNSTKMAPVFSPDGSRIAYTATDTTFGWNTWVVPVLGGEPKEILPNAAALTWTNSRHVMFSETRLHSPMGIAAAQESRGEERDIYFPTLGGMAHRSWLSPNGKWVLISEMDKLGWRPCRLVPFDGSTVGETVGPSKTRCTYAGWSPDGATMYFSADAGDGYHIWRQHFPGGTPEQLTFGATEEEGIAISSDGRSLITSAGIRESTVWLHDHRGDRQISGEGFASMPGLGFGIASAHSTFSPDGKKLYYLVRGNVSRAWTSGELWMAYIDSGRTESVLPGVSMSGFDIAPDGERVAFWTPDAEGIPHAWVAPLDRRSPPKQLTSSESQWPSFGPAGEIYILIREGGHQFIAHVGPDGVALRKMTAVPDGLFTADSPLGDLFLTGFSPLIAQPIQGGSPTKICSFCSAGWGPGGRFLYVRFRGVGETGPGKTIVIGLRPGKELPQLPSSGLNSVEEAERLNVVAEINTTGMTYFVPGPDPSIYAFVRATTQRNLFRIPLN